MLSGKAKGPEPSRFDQLLSEFDTFFEGAEEVGPEVCNALANLVNASLRRKPNDATVRTTLAKYPVPSNMSNLQVPKTNADVMEAMAKGPSVVDHNLRKVQLAVSKAMVPILRWMHDFAEGKAISFSKSLGLHLDVMTNCLFVFSGSLKPGENYLQTLHDSLRLMAASFNWLSHCRKDVVRNNIRDHNVGKLCGWDTPVGETSLFACDVTKTVDEMRKTRKLGASTSFASKGHKFTRQSHYKAPYKSNYDSPAKPKKRKKSFLGQGQHQKGKKKN